MLIPMDSISVCMVPVEVSPSSVKSLPREKCGQKNKCPDPMACPEALSWGQ